MLCSMVISYQHLTKIDALIFMVDEFVPLKVGTWLLAIWQCSGGTYCPHIYGWGI